MNLKYIIIFIIFIHLNVCESTRKQKQKCDIRNNMVATTNVINFSRNYTTQNSVSMCCNTCASWRSKCSFFIYDSSYKQCFIYTGVKKSQLKFQRINGYTIGFLN